MNTSPETMESGIWQSDTGPAADEDGNVYLATGNGVFDAAAGGRDYGDSLLRLRIDATGLHVHDYFTPFDQAQLSRTDADLGSGGPMLIPPEAAEGAKLAVVGGKGGVIYLLNRDNMGKFDEKDDRKALQKIDLGKPIKSAPAYWNGRVYYAAGDDFVREFAVRKRQLQQVSASVQDLREPGATPTISANGKTDGILWLIETKVWNGPDRPATLHAYNAINVSRELYSSDQAGVARRFNIPAVANGRVYIGVEREVDVYGLLSEPQNGSPNSQ